MGKLSRTLVSVALAGALILTTLLAGCGSGNSQTPNATSASTTAASSAAATTASSSQDNTSNGVTKLNMYGGYTGPDLEIMQGIIDKFNSTQKDIQIQLTSLQWSPMFAKFFTDYMAGSPPDILIMHSFEVGSFVSKGVLDPKAIQALSLKKDDYVSTAWNSTMYNNVQYGVPMDIDAHGLYYNKDMFAKAGITEPPKTGKDLIADAQKLTVDKNGKHPTDAGFDANNTKVYGLGFLMNHHVFYQVVGLLSQQGSSPLTDTMTSVTFDPEKTAAAFKYLQDFIFKYKVTPKGEKASMDDFVAGNVAMAVDGPWEISTVEGSKINWGVAPYPQVFDKPGVWGASTIMTIPLNPKRTDAQSQATQTFINWFVQNSADWAKSGHLLASKSALQQLASLPGRDAFISEQDYINFLPAHIKSTQLFSSTAPSPILTAAQSAVLDDTDPKAIVEQLQKDMNAVLK